MTLTAVEARALGSLVEKSLTTPDAYPLTFGALNAACNQKTSRDPVMTIDVDALGKAAQSLIDKGLVERIQGAGDRVPKFRHYFSKLTGSDDERINGIACVLLLRGPQTAGEIKGRTDRLCKFESTAEVEGLLQQLAAAQEPFIARVPRQPGQKEGRYRETFTGGAAASVPSPSPLPLAGEGARRAGEGHVEQRVDELEKRVEILEGLVDQLMGKTPAPTET